MNRLYTYVRDDPNQWHHLSKESFELDWTPVKEQAKSGKSTQDRAKATITNILERWGEEARELVEHQLFNHIQKVRALSIKAKKKEEGFHRLNRVIMWRKTLDNRIGKTWKVKPCPSDFIEALLLDNSPEYTVTNLERANAYINQSG